MGSGTAAHGGCDNMERRSNKELHNTWKNTKGSNALGDTTMTKMIERMLCNNGKLLKSQRRFFSKNES